jgi:hypothetical protein
MGVDNCHAYYIQEKLSFVQRLVLLMANLAEHMLRLAKPND